MEESRQLVCRALFQQERQPDLDPKIDSVDGLDAESWKASRCMLDDRLPNRLTSSVRRSRSGNGTCPRGIGDGIGKKRGHSTFLPSAYKLKVSGTFFHFMSLFSNLIRANSRSLVLRSFSEVGLAVKYPFSLWFNSCKPVSSAPSVFYPPSNSATFHTLHTFPTFLTSSPPTGPPSSF